jgi:hypothetical protein
VAHILVPQRLTSCTGTFNIFVDRIFLNENLSVFDLFVLSTKRRTRTLYFHRVIVFHNRQVEFKVSKSN